MLGLQTDDEYSTNGRASVLYAISWMAGDFVLILMKSRDQLADVHIFWMWLLKDRLSLISTPKYLEPPTDSSRYSLATEVLARVTCMTKHLLELNSMSHCSFHS